MCNHHKHHEIPEILFGAYPSVVSKCGRVAKRALEVRNWTTALEPAEYRSLDELWGCLVVDMSPGRVGATGEQIFLAPLLNQLWKIWRGRLADPADINRRYPIVRDLMLSGMDTFWFSLVMLGQGGWLRGCAAYEAEKAAVSRAAASKLLVWWPDFVLLHDRFDWRSALSRSPYKRPPIEWYRWGERLILLCIESGMTPEVYRPIIRMSATEAAEAVRRWLGETERCASLL